MLRPTLTAALLLGLYGSAVQAQDFDDRWYVRPHIGVNFTDTDRAADDGVHFGLGVGRRFSERVGIEFDINHASSDLDRVPGDWDLTGIGAALKFYPVTTEGLTPYLKAGLGTLRHRRDGSANDGWATEFKIGPGVEYMINDRITFGAEVLYRYDADDESLLSEDSYGDWLALVGVNVALGETSAPAPEPTPEPAPEPTPEPTPAPMSTDDDKDGVNNPKDRCPNTPAGQMVNPDDGCPVEEVIDLRGVNFDFDKSTLRPDAIQILNNAVEVLKKHNVRVSVEGHTDAVGTDAYNQGLSERRAKAVYDYLTANGVAADKIVGSKGWGEAKPIDTNESADGRANNRRTELVKQQ
jgi:OOP family OmpA-OmpF porin